MTDEKINQDAPSTEPEDATEVQMVHRYVKMTSGESIICTVPDTEMDNYLLARYPLQLTTMITPDSEDAMFALSPWIPFTNQEFIPINSINIITICPVVTKMAALYERQLKRYLELVEAAHQGIHEPGELMDEEIKELSEEIEEKGRKRTCRHSATNG